MGAGNHHYTGISIIRRPSPPYPFRLLASNLDAFHSMSVEVGPTLEHSEFGFIADDFVNLHNRLLPVAQFLPLQSRVSDEASRVTAASRDVDVAVAAKATLTLIDVGDAPAYNPMRGHSGAGIHSTHTMDSVLPGDVLKVYNITPPHSLLGTVVVSSSKNVQDKPIPSLPPPLDRTVEPGSLALWQIEFTNSTIKGAVPPFGSVVQIDRLASAGAIVRHNHFHDSYNNAGRFAASNLHFADNLLERCEDGIHISYDIAISFLEGSLGMTNLTLINNTFVTVMGCGAGRSGAHGCNQTCNSIECVLSHVDPDLANQVHASGNIVRVN